MKVCGQCGAEKEPSQFHKRAASIDGLAACCKACQKIYDRARLYKPERVALRARIAEELPYEKKRQYILKSIAKHPEKRAAHVAVGNALRDGKIFRKPCEECGTERTQAHHDDYSKPLEVRWLCVSCHNEHHKNLRLPDYPLRKQGVSPTA